MSIWICPICGGHLSSEGKSLFCPKRHCFDKSKSGYSNLLPVHKTHSKAPGDNKQMVNGRSAFLNKGYYQPFRDAICEAVAAAAHDLSEGESAGKPISLLDAGCGEGYYTVAMAEALEACAIPARLYGVDISKLAVDSAARRTKQVAFAVASVFDLPVAGQSCGILTEIFAPFCREEFWRVLKPGGWLLLGIPARDHLLELKQAVYEHPYENERKPYELEGFTLAAKREVQTRIHLESAEDIQNLFMMTPYSYKTSRADTERLLTLQSLETMISFEILSYQKEHSSNEKKG